MSVAACNLPGSYLVLELTNKCPLRCGHCAVSEADDGHPHYAEISYLKPALIEELLRDLAGSGLRFDALVLFWLGEPLSHPQFPEIYELILRYSGDGEIFGKIEVHSNGFPLVEKVARVALNDRAVPQIWHLTMDAISAPTFHIIKGVDAFEKSQRNARRMVKLKGESEARWPKLAVQFIVSDVNAHEAEDFARYWERAFTEEGLPVKTTGFHVPVHGPENYVYLKSLDCPTPQEQERQNAIYLELMARLGLRSPVDAAAEQRASAKVPRRLQNTCSGFFKSPSIGSDGRITVCTRDSMYHLAIGSLHDGSFSEFWLGSDVLNRRRQQVARGDYSELPYCQSCFIPQSVNYSEISAEQTASFLRGAGLDGGLVPKSEQPSRWSRPFPDPYSADRDTVYGDRLQGWLKDEGSG